MEIGVVEEQPQESVFIGYGYAFRMEYSPRERHRCRKPFLALSGEEELELDPRGWSRLVELTEGGGPVLLAVGAALARPPEIWGAVGEDLTSPEAGGCQSAFKCVGKRFISLVGLKPRGGPLGPHKLDYTKRLDKRKTLETIEARLFDSHRPGVGDCEFTSLSMAARLSLVLFSILHDKRLALAVYSPERPGELRRMASSWTDTLRVDFKFRIPCSTRHHDSKT